MAADARRDAELAHLVTTVAWLYHERHWRQSAIATRLGISQSRVSRLLDQAVELKIVRTVVVAPEALSSPLELEVEAAYGLQEAHVYHLGETGADDDLTEELGQLLALHLPAMLSRARIVGLTSWSRSLSAAVSILHPLRQAEAEFVVELLGDLGPPILQHEAAGVTQRLAHAIDATPVFLRIPGVSTTPTIRTSLLEHDQHAQEVLELLDTLDVALVGIGSGQVVAPLKSGDNFFTSEQFAYARAQGAVGEVNLHFIDGHGTQVAQDLDELIVGASWAQLSRATRRIGVAGGPAKHRAIRAALLGGWINSLITDSVTARYLLDHR